MTKLLSIVTGSVLYLMIAWVPLFQTEATGATTFTRVTVQSVDTAVPSLTFRTTDGQQWTLSATSAELLNGVNKGDTCTLEIDLQDRVVKILKASSDLPTY